MPETSLRRLVEALLAARDREAVDDVLSRLREDQRFPPEMVLQIVDEVARATAVRSAPAAGAPGRYGIDQASWVLGRTRTQVRALCDRGDLTIDHTEGELHVHSESLRAFLERRRRDQTILRQILERSTEVRDARVASVAGVVRSRAAALGL